MTTYQLDGSLLEKVLVLTVQKSFWASSECAIFPKQVYANTLYGYSQNKVNSLLMAIKSLAYVAVYRPKLILFGSVHRIVPWFARFKQAGLLPGIKLVATNQVYFNDQLARYIDKIIVYSRCEIARHAPALQEKYMYLPLPTDGKFDSLQSITHGNYIFSGGGHRRDFATLIRAASTLDIPLKIVTFSPKTLNFAETLPDNCDVTWTLPLQEFLAVMAAARFVVVPLQAGGGAHGHTTIAQALRLGKPVITTTDASIDDYVVNGQEGFLVTPGDVEGYRQAISKLWQDTALRTSCEHHALVKAQELTYAAFANQLVGVCQTLLSTPECKQ